MIMGSDTTTSTMEIVLQLIPPLILALIAYL